MTNLVRFLSPCILFTELFLQLLMKSRIILFETFFFLG